MTRPVTRESQERGRSQELPVDADGTAMPASQLPDLARKGRGAVSNRPGRYEPGNRPREDDGWSGPESEDEDLPPLRTTVTIDATRSAIARNNSPDIGFDRSINPYRGCEHGCIYCFARPTHAYLGLSPGLDFESQLFAKPDAAALLARELSKPGYTPRTDRARHQYRSLSADRAQDAHHPRASSRCCAASTIRSRIVTKSALVLRDIDILAAMARKRLATRRLSVTTLDAASRAQDGAARRHAAAAAGGDRARSPRPASRRA